MTSFNVKFLFFPVWWILFGDNIIPSHAQSIYFSLSLFLLLFYFLWSHANLLEIIFDDDADGLCFVLLLLLPRHVLNIVIILIVDIVNDVVVVVVINTVVENSFQINFSSLSFVFNFINFYLPLSLLLFLQLQ